MLRDTNGLLRNGNYGMLGSTLQQFNGVLVETVAKPLYLIFHFSAVSGSAKSGIDSIVLKGISFVVLDWLLVTLCAIGVSYFSFTVLESILCAIDRSFLALPIVKACIVCTFFYKAECLLLLSLKC